MKPTGTRASRAAASRSERGSARESTTGSVLGIATTAQKPPAAAARVPVSRSSLCSWPGVRRCTCGSTKPGNRCAPAPSSASAPSGAAIAGRADLGDPPVAHEHVVRAVEPGARVEHVGAADQQVAGGAGARERARHASWGSPAARSAGASCEAALPAGPSPASAPASSS